MPTNQFILWERITQLSHVKFTILTFYCELILYCMYFIVILVDIFSKRIGEKINSKTSRIDAPCQLWIISMGKAWHLKSILSHYPTKTVPTNCSIVNTIDLSKQPTKHKTWWPQYSCAFAKKRKIWWKIKFGQNCATVILSN